MYCFKVDLPLNFIIDSSTVRFFCRIVAGTKGLLQFIKDRPDFTVIQRGQLPLGRILLLSTKCVLPKNQLNLLTGMILEMKSSLSVRSED